MKYSNLQTLDPQLITELCAQWEYQDFANFSQSLALENYKAYGVLDKNQEKIISTIFINIGPEDVELMYIYTGPEFRKQGLGLFLIEEVTQILKNLGKKKLFLEVEDNNQSAINLYKKLFFREINRRQNYYGNGHHAICFVRELVN